MKTIPKEKEKLSPKEKQEKEEFHKMVQRLNELDRKNPKPLEDWLEMSE